ncbi:hypothetical protein [Brevundimonas sp. FT23028]|uniref:hypothetical protein n=1 Tax=Brevundimonas sp. FT23028 TaxID=3393748 RepID=UPI003B585BCB
MRPGFGLAALGGALLLSAGATAQAQSLGVYPVGGLFGLDATACGRPAGAVAGQDTAYVSPDLCFAVTPERRAALGERFRQRVAARFPGVVTDLSAAQGAGVTREATVTGTAVASLHLTRLDFWRVPNNRTVEVHAPLGLTLLVSDMATGEVLFSETLNGGVRGVMSRGDDLRQVQGQIDSHLETAIDTLVDQAAARFQPRALTARVRGRAGDRFVIDQGRSSGLRDGDVLDGDIRVVHADAAYAIVEPLLGSLTVGQPVSRSVAQPTAALARPSMMVVVADAPERVGRRHLAAMMETALGEATSFSAAPVNPSFVEIRDLALGQSGAAYRPRALPDYFLRVTAMILPPVSMSSASRGVPIRAHQARVLVEVVDRAGRVLFAGQGVESWRAAEVEDLSFSADQRDDLALTAAVGHAAEAIGRDFRPQPLRLPASPAGEGVRIADAGGALTPGLSASVLRRVGRMSGVEGEVWAPVAEVEVVSTDDAGAVARFAGVDDSAVRSGDQLAWEAPALATASRRWFMQCADARGVPTLSERGSIRQSTFGPIALNAFAGAFRAPVRIRGFENELRPLLVGQFEGLERMGVLTPPPEDVCFEPVYAVEPRGAGRSRPGLILSDYDLTVGYSLRRAGQRVEGGVGKQQTLNDVAVATDADPATRDRVLQQALAEATSTMARQAALETAPPR